MKILAIDTRMNIIPFEFALADYTLPIPLQTVNNFNDAIRLMDNHPFDLLIVGSGIIIQDGMEGLLKIKSGDRFKSLPLIVLTEFEGGEHNLFENNLLNTFFIARPYDLNEMPSLLNKIFGFWMFCKQTEKKGMLKCTHQR